MASITPIEQASDKWVKRASIASGDYQTGVLNPRRSWAEASTAAESNYKQGVVAAANAGRYGQGVKAAGDSRWKDMAAKKGPGRFAEGVAVGRDDWAKGFSPYHSAISALTLPVRGPKGDPKNLARVTAVAQTLRAVFEKKGR